MLEWKSWCVSGTNMASDPVDSLLDAVAGGRSIIVDRAVLHSAHMPDLVLHRDEEQKAVAQVLIPILKGSRPSNLLVYGKPGTGKTLVVRKVISQIQARAADSEFPIRLVYSNAKDETTLGGLLVSLGKQLGMDQKRLPVTGLAIGEVFKRILEEVDGRGLNVVFVIDEIDHLAQLVGRTGKDILYQLTSANMRLDRGTLTIVGISNNLSFKENLDPRVISRLADEEAVFTTYTTEQIRKILEERVAAAFAPGAVEEPALNLCAALSGSEHGDARRAIDLLRIAGEIAERAAGGSGTDSQTVTIEHVREASKKMEEDKEMTVLQSYPLHEKLLILAIMRSEASSTGEVYSHYKSLCRDVAAGPLTQRRVTQMLSEIELSGIVSGRVASRGVHGRTKKHRLTVSPQTVKKAFAEDLALQGLL